MSKLFKTIMKNYKILFRNRDSAAVVVLGPLMIMLLVGLAFNNSQSFEVRVGTYTPDNSGLTPSFIQNLEVDYELQAFLTEKECIDGIKTGEVHICVSFPPNFNIENQKVNNVSLFVDNSRQNLVYQVIETIKATVQSSSEDISLELTTDLLEAIRNTQSTTASNLATVLVLKQDAELINTENNQVISNANTINLESGSISLSGVKTELTNLKKELADIGDAASTADDIETAYASTAGGNFTPEMDLLIESLEKLENSSVVSVEEAIASVDAASSSISEIETSIEVAKVAKTNINTKSNNIKTKITNVKTQLDGVKTGLEFVQAQIDALTVTDAENIVNPVNTNIEPVITENSRLVFLFPFLVILVIMLVSILLSSTLIVLEKSSRAFFRNFTTSTKDEHFIFSTFMTSFLLVFSQAIIIMIVGVAFLKAPLLSNWGMTLLVLVLTITLFVMIGMAIGYSLNTQQSSNMVSISFASIFLLLSNLILPLEAVGPALKTATQFNPYVIASELLRRTLLFDATIVQVNIELGFILLYSILIFIIIMMTHKISKIKYLGILPHKKLKITTVGEDDSFDIGEEFIVRTKEDLYVALVKIDDTDYENYIVNNRKEFILWIKEGLKDPSLARKARKLNREQLIYVLEKIIDKKKLPHTQEFENKQKEEKKLREEMKAFQPDETSDDTEESSDKEKNNSEDKSKEEKSSDEKSKDSKSKDSNKKNKKK